MTNEKPRLLFVTYHFPPDTSIGSKRAHRIASHMARLGWEVDVLCARSIYQTGLDERLTAGLDDVRVIPTHSINPRIWAKSLAGRLRAKNANPDKPRQKSSKTSSDGRIGQLYSRVSRWLEIPDEGVGWIPIALSRATFLPRPSLVLASAPYFTNALAATSVASFFGVPLILDYRDPWAPSKHRDYLPVLRQKMETWLETRCLNRVDTLISVTPGIAEQLASQCDKTAHVITNACEPERLEGVSPKDFHRPTLVYAGGLYRGRTLKPVLESLARLRDGGLNPGELGLFYMGPHQAKEQQLASLLELDDYVTCEGVRPNDEALAAMMGAAANLVLVSPAHVGQIPGKLFDAISTQRPVLAIVPDDSDTEVLMKQLGMGACIGWEDPEGLDRVLGQYANQPLRNVEQPIPESISAAATMDAFNKVLRQTLNETS